MVKSKIFAFFIAFAVCPLSSFKAYPETEKFSLKKAIETALKNNHQVTAAQIEIESKRRNYVFSWNKFVPQVDAGSSLSRRNNSTITMAGLSLPPPLPSIPPSEKRLSEKELWSFAGMLKMSWAFTPAMIESIILSKKEYEAGKISLLKAQHNLKKQVAKAYFGLGLQNAVLKIAGRNLAESEEKLKEAKLHYKNGRMPELTVLSNEIEVAKQKLNLQKAQSNADEQLSMFVFLLGLPYGTQIEISTEEIPLDLTLLPEITKEAYFAGRMNLEELEKNRESLKSQIKVLQMQTFSPVLSITQNFVPIISFANSNWGDKKNWNDTGSFTITLAFSLTNMLPFSAQSIAIQKAKDAEKKLQLALNSEKFNREMEFEKLNRLLKESAASIESMELQNTLAKKAYKLTKEAYYAGQKTLLELTSAETVLMQTELGLSREKFSYICTLIDLGLYPLP